MKLFSRHLRTFIWAGTALATLGLGTPSWGAAVFTPPTASYHPDLKLIGINAATASYSNATTSYTDIAGTSITLPATTKDYSLRYVRVCYSADATKATSTTGTIRVYANGAGIAASARTISSAAGQGVISECYTVARSSGASQTIKLQGVSGDTAAFTIANAQVEVWELFNGAM